MKINPTYQDSVFANCPFDKLYDYILKPIVYTVYSCGFVPRSAMEEDDASNTRIEKIERLILNCRFGIHDISRTELDKTTQLPRFNMPFELGIFWGSKKFGTKLQKEKVALVFEKEKYSYQKYLSDINGVDIKAHNNDIEKVITQIRNWLFTTTSRNTIPLPSQIIKGYKDFIYNKLPASLALNHTDINDLTFNDLCVFVKNALLVKLKQD